MVPAAGVEPATFRSGGERSNPLSYAGLNKMACFKEMNQECPPFCPPFLTVFVPLVKYRAALVSSQIESVKIAPPILPVPDCSHLFFSPRCQRWQGAYNSPEILNQTVLK